MTDVPARPNIIFFFSDQQRWDSCGCYGQPLDVTPNLDRMAAEGVRFEMAFTCQPVCGPARACLQTGKYATETGNFKNNTSLPQDERTIAHILADAGYETAYVGKWHLASDEENNYRTLPVPPERRGGYRDFWVASDVLEHTSHGYGGHMFDTDGNKVEFPPDRFRADACTDIALEYLRNRKTDRPFFLFLSYIEPHHQNDRERYEGPTGSKKKYQDFVVPGDLQDAEGDWRENYPDYLGCCNALDANLGRIRSELEDQGIADNTLILYTSDHGSHFRTRNREYKRSCHDGCIRIPMVAWGGAFTGGKVVEELASLIDIPPTILTAAGLEPPETHRGRPLQHLALRKSEDWREEAFLQISEDHIGRALRTHRWTYEIAVPGVPGGEFPDATEYTEAHLYDNHADPHQKNNLVADPACADIRADLAVRLRRIMHEIGEPEMTLRAAEA